MKTPHQLGSGSSVTAQLSHPRNQRAESDLEDGVVELPLAPEVVVDHGLVDAGSTRQGLDPYAREARLGEQLRTRSEQRLTSRRRVSLFLLASLH